MVNNIIILFWNYVLVNFHCTHLSEYNETFKWKSWQNVKELCCFLVYKDRVTFPGPSNVKIWALLASIWSTRTHKHFPLFSAPLIPLTVRITTKIHYGSWRMCCSNAYSWSVAAEGKWQSSRHLSGDKGISEILMGPLLKRPLHPLSHANINGSAIQRLITAVTPLSWVSQQGGWEHG